MSGIRKLLGAIGSVACLGLAAMAGPAFAQGAHPKYVNGELMITVQSGTPRATVDAIAASVNSVVVKTWAGIDTNKIIDAHLLRMSAAGVNEQQTVNAANALKADARIRFASAHKIYYTRQVGSVTPNDPRFAEQYGHRILKLPQAYGLEKGNARAMIVIIDTSFDDQHPDLKDRITLKFNSTDGSNNVAPSNNTDAHGTHVAGIAAASTDNGIGVAGANWQNSQLVVIKASTNGAGFSNADLLTALAFVRTLRTNNPALGIVCNMSLGSNAASDVPDLTDPFALAILAAANVDVVFTISAGNDAQSGNPPDSPGNLASIHQNILCIGSVGQNEKRAIYSQFRSYTTVASPGGDQSIDPGILSTIPVAQGSYGFFQGTSMAAPYAAGVVGLVLSVPGVKATDVKTVLTSTARQSPGQPTPNPEYGYGIIDAFEALKKVSISVTIDEPIGTGGKATANGNVPNGDPVETTRPIIKISVNQITQANLTITIDQRQITDYAVTNVRATGTDANNNTIPVSYDVVIPKDGTSAYASGMDTLGPGQHKIEVSGVNAALPQAVTDERYINVTPHQIPSGRSLISIPYLQGGAIPETYFGTSFKLARWLPDQARYVFYSSVGVRDAEASFAPTGVTVTQDGGGASIAPLGLAFWSDTDTARPVVTRGAALTDKPIVITLKGNGTGDARFVSWNMIGSPFPFDVPFSALMVDAPEGRISIAEAAKKGYVVGNVYTYEGLATGYTFKSLPDGALKAWTGHWVGVTSKQNLKLVIPPSRIGRAANVNRAAGNSMSGWKLRLGASVGNMSDMNNFIGAAKEANDGWDRLDAPKPPLPAPYVAMGVQQQINGRGVLMAQDIRSMGRTQKWSVSVDTDQRNQDVVLNWSSATLPRNLRLTIKDETTGQTVDMRTRATTSFNTGETPSVRLFTVEAKPTNGAVLAISNLAVRTVGTRASGTARIGFTLSTDATYDVTVLSSTGRLMNNISTRAAGTGDVNLVWNGKDQVGRSVPAGTYLLQVRASNSDGEVVRAFQPFTLVR